MSIQTFRSLFHSRRFLTAGLSSTGGRFAHSHDTSVKPVNNDPENAHLTFRPAILDDLPEPKGDWLEDYQKRNRKYWAHFFLGLTTLSATVYCMIEYELVFFNFVYPELPPKEERIKSFWIPSEDEDDDE